MVTDVMTIEPTATLAAAARLMDEGNIGMLPVVEDEQVRGVITDRDIVVRAVARDADASNIRVGDCLTSFVVFAHPGWTTD